MPKLAANLSTLFPQLEFLDRFAAAAQAGFRAVEYQFPYASKPEELAARARDTGCRPGRERQFREDLERAVAYARAVSCERVHCLAGVLPEGGERARAHAAYVANLKYAAARPRDEGMKLLIEPLSTRAVPGYFLP